MPENEGILTTAGLLFVGQEKWSSAIEVLQRLVKIQKDKSQPLILQLLARALALDSKVPEALELIKTAIKQHPENEELLQELESIQTNSKS